MIRLTTALYCTKLVFVIVRSQAEIYKSMRRMLAFGSVVLYISIWRERNNEKMFYIFELFASNYYKDYLEKDYWLCRRKYFRY